MTSVTHVKTTTFQIDKLDQFVSRQYVVKDRLCFQVVDASTARLEKKLVETRGNVCTLMMLMIPLQGKLTSFPKLAVLKEQFVV